MPSITRSNVSSLINYMDTYPTAIPLTKLTRTDNPKIIIMVGGPASGKSLARQLCADKCEIDNAIILNPDNIIEKKFNSDNSKRREVNELFGYLYKYIFDLGPVNIIYDRTGAYFEHTEFIVNLINSLKLFKTYKYEIILCMSIVPPEIGQSRALLREKETGRNVPTVVIDNIYKSIDNILMDYQTNQEVVLFKNLTDARLNLSGQPTRYISIDDNDNLILPTKFKGLIAINKRDYILHSDQEQKNKFITPRSGQSITKESDVNYPNDKPLLKDSRIQIKLLNATIIINNVYHLFDKIIAYDNSAENPELIYYYDNGVKYDKELSTLIKEQPYGKYSALRSITARINMGGRKKSKRRTKRTRTKRTRTKRARTKRTRTKRKRSSVK